MLSPTSLVLVCLSPEPRELEIARLLGWFRIPFKSAPKVVSEDYLAFYYPGIFGDLGAQIKYVAEVKGYELTTRLELLRDKPNHPAHTRNIIRSRSAGSKNYRIWSKPKSGADSHSCTPPASIG